MHQPAPNGVDTRLKLAKHVALLKMLLSYSSPTQIPAVSLEIWRPGNTMRVIEGC